MCGIAGFIGEGSFSDAEQMIARLRHRGPDDFGVVHWAEGAFAHARLSIVDLSPTGHQPMTSSDGNLLIVFNGEIYNHKSLRSHLESRGRKFVGTSDTEVVLNLYAEFGIAAFAMLEGMFAIALYDHTERQCTLVRDRYGEKPLFWSLQAGTLFFASELKALLAHQSYKGKLDRVSMQKFLFSEYIPGPSCIFQDTFKLEPASWLQFKNGKILRGFYWKASYKEIDINPETAINNFGNILAQATSRMIENSDVPVGILLSGGLDSSAIAYFAQRSSSKQLKTFSVGFQDAQFDESSHARVVASSLGTEHHEIHVSERDLLDTISHIAEIADEPLADPSLIPTACLARFASQHVKVALGGDGADELLAGYETFNAERFASQLGMIPQRFWSIVEPLINMLRASSGYMSIDFVMKKFIRGMLVAPELRHSYWLSSFTPQEQSALLRSPMRTEDFTAIINADVMKYLQDVESASSLSRLSYIYSNTYLVNDILVKLDRASMHFGLEVRAPFLDVHVSEYVNSMPDRYRRRGGRGKWMLRELMKDKLPSDIIKRKKHGFAIPLAQWFRGPLRTMCIDFLLAGQLVYDGFMKPEEISRILQEHTESRHNHYKQIWTLLTLELWLRRWKKEIYLS